MIQEDLEYLNEHKANDKEWFLLRNEPNVTIKTVDDIIGLSQDIKDKLIAIKNEPLKGEALKIYNICIKQIDADLRNDKLQIKI